MAVIAKAMRVARGQGQAVVSMLEAAAEVQAQISPSASASPGRLDVTA